MASPGKIVTLSPSPGTYSAHASHLNPFSFREGAAHNHFNSSTVLISTARRRRAYDSLPLRMSTLSKPLPFGQRIGDFILAEISAISASSVIILLGYIAVRFLNPVEWHTSLNAAPLKYSAVTVRQDARRRWRLTSPVHLFLLNQLVCDLIQALGKRCPAGIRQHLIHARWTDEPEVDD
jgi:hypothetical protein